MSLERSLRKSFSLGFATALLHRPGRFTEGTALLGGKGGEFEQEAADS
jgi:hypothetical protein